MKVFTSLLFWLIFSNGAIGCIAFDNIYFENGSSSIDSSEQDKIKFIGNYLKSHPKLTLVIHGHTDSTESKELSFQRAKAVRNYLLNFGIDSCRISVHGFGSKRKVSPNLKKNRRVNFKLDETRSPILTHKSNQVKSIPNIDSTMANH